MKDKKKKQRVTEADWRHAALTEIAQNGVNGVSVEALAARLDVAKSSFYGYYKDRDALLMSALRSWERHVLYDFVEHLEAKGLAAREKLAEVLRICLQSPEKVPGIPGGPLEAAFRNWAQTDQRAMKTVRNVQRKRLELIRDIYIEMGLDPDNASRHAFGLVAYLTGQTILASTETKSEIRRRYEYGNALWIESITLEIET